ncbi:MAG: ankyrin repeat domain-containing protein [Deltaproteobacteria bacterium]|nr:ankyrin repeat domain-containing protein [Deltaproteobacteria bacterium]
MAQKTLYLPADFARLIKEKSSDELLEMVKKLGPNARDGKSQRTALFYPELTEALAVRLIEAGSDVKARDLTNRTPLHFQVEGNSAVAEALIKNGAYLDARDNRQQTPLHLAAACLNPKSVFSLVAYGASLQIGDFLAQSPLVLALTAGRRHNLAVLLEVTEILLEGGAEITYDSLEEVVRLKDSIERVCSNLPRAEAKKSLALLNRLHKHFKAEIDKENPGHPSMRHPLEFLSDSCRQNKIDLYRDFVPSEGPVNCVQGEVLLLADTLFRRFFVSHDFRNQETETMLNKLLEQFKSGLPLTDDSLQKAARLAKKIAQGRTDLNCHLLIEMAVEWVLQNPFTY